MKMMTDREISALIGQKVTGFKESDIDFWIILETDIIRVNFPKIDFECLDCVENGDK